MMSKIIAWLIALSLIPCAYLICQTHLSIIAAHKLHGTVVGYDTRVSSETKKKLYAVRVEYIDRGVKYQMTSSTASDHPSKRIGDSVVVLDYGDGSWPSLFLFGDIFTPYWIWLCIAMTTGGCLVWSAVMNTLYSKFHVECLVPYEMDPDTPSSSSSGAASENLQAKLLVCWIMLCIGVGAGGFFIGTTVMEWLYL